MPEDLRSEACRAFAMRALGLRELRWCPASADASFRRYFRASAGDASWVVMDAPPEHEDCRPFVDVAQRLLAAGLHAPRVLAMDLDAGILVLEDLGRQTLLEAIVGGAPPEGLMQAALAALARMQAAVETDGLPSYDEALLRREMGLFRDWLLARLLRIEPGATEDADLRALEDWLVARIQAQPRVFVHRDYMLRNLMHSDPMPGIIDFQDAVVGPYAYDPACLMRDAFVSWPDARIEGWLADWHAMARRLGAPVPELGQMMMDVRTISVQRHLKVAGIFARLHLRDGKPRYLPEIPRFIGYLREAAAVIEPLAAIDGLLARVQRALAR